jgi:hypothetical protein
LRSCSTRGCAGIKRLFRIASAFDGSAVIGSALYLNFKALFNQGAFFRFSVSPRSDLFQRAVSPRSYFFQRAISPRSYFFQRAISPRQSLHPDLQNSPRNVQVGSRFER